MICHNDPFFRETVESEIRNYVKKMIFGGVLMSPTTGWQPMASGYLEIVVGVDAATGTVATALYTIQIATDSAGNNVVATLNNLEMTVEVS